jgi:hypothetical protein
MEVAACTKEGDTPKRVQAATTMRTLRRPSGFAEGPVGPELPVVRQIAPDQWDAPVKAKHGGEPAPSVTCQGPDTAVSGPCRVTGPAPATGVDPGVPHLAYRADAQRLRRVVARIRLSTL